MNFRNCAITVYYDGSCPKCIRDRQRYERLAGNGAGDVCWFDITGREERLREIGIDPRDAMLRLHVQTEDRQIRSELDAYILLMKKVPVLRPLAWLIGLPVIRPLLSKIYQRQVERRLRRNERL
jgi:predicted DCC family thiol-disulfide oxidoreductase YuxK